MLVPQPYRDRNSLITESGQMFVGEQEEEDWNTLAQYRPIFAMGSGAFSENNFGFYYPSKGKITRLSINAYPVEIDSTLTLRIRVVGENNSEYEFPDYYTFTGNMESKDVSLYLPFNENQVVVQYVSSNYPSSNVRVRTYIYIEK
jgi:hypothetical protein